ncbi:MAG: hypothetical protein CMP51_02485 [Flavobacteriales bacterium]|nr:hypothetical protein [Flavobacteriales bacterium]
MKNKLSILLIFISLVAFSQNSNIFSKKNTNNNQEIDEKKLIEYKINFYKGIKEKTLSNYESGIKYFKKCIEVENKEPIAYYEISKLFFEINDHAQALIYSEKAANLDEENKWYMEFYADNLFNNFEFEKAISIYKKLIKSNSVDEGYYISIAKSYIYLNNYRKAIEAYNQLQSVIGISRFLSIEKHKLYLELNKINLAIKELNELLAEFPNDIQLIQMIAELYLQNNEIKESEKTLRDALLIDNQSVELYFQLSDLMLIDERFEDHIIYLHKGFSSETNSEEIKITKLLEILDSPKEGVYIRQDLDSFVITIFNKHPNSEGGNYLYADLLKKDNYIDSSLYYFRRVIEINPNNQSAWLETMFILAQKSLYSELLETSSKALEVFPTNPTIYYLNGLSLYNKEFKLEAIKSIKMGINFIVQNDVFNAEMYGFLATIYDDISDFEKSDKNFEKSLVFFPNNPTVLNNWAYFLSLREENLEKAKEMSEKSIEISDGPSHYYDTYAWILYKMKRFDEAKSYMKIAIEKMKEPTKVYFEHMAEILERTGDIEESKNFRQKAENFD